MNNVFPKLTPVNKDDLNLVGKDIAAKLDKKWKDGLAVHRLRVSDFHFFTRVAHNLNLYEKARKDAFSEGSTQTIKRKIRAQTIQRVPDGEITTQYDKNSIEQAEIDYLFKHKILTSEYDGKDMMKNLWRSFNAAYDYGFACVRTGFEEDLDGDPRISYTIIPYNDVIPSPDCNFIEEADWYIIREWLPLSNLKLMIDKDTGAIKDPTWDADAVRYIVENELVDGQEPQSKGLSDKKRGVTKNKSVEVRTYYCRGEDEFVTYAPSINCIIRRVKNYDPRKDVPIHFLILEPDPEFPYGASSILWTLAQQQYADAFQSTAYQTLLLSLHPPLMVFGNLANPKLKMKANAIWPMGTNPNNKIEKFPVETTTVTQYGSILENISGRMMQSLNVTDATVASDAEVARYSATPQGVEQQRMDRTITINQYQKRIEIFFQEWANHALRSYINSMTGKQWITVDEKTRRRIQDIEEASRNEVKMAMQDALEEDDMSELETNLDEETIVGDEKDRNKIEIDFDSLSADLLSFEVRAGSLIENERETERQNIQTMLVPVSQMIGNISDENKDAFEQVIMQLVTRLCELSDIDISATAAQRIDQKLMAQALQATMDMVNSQQQQIGQMQQMMGLPQGGMPPEMTPGMAAGAMSGAPMPEEPMPPEMMAAEGAPMPPEMMMGGGGMPPSEGLPPEAGMPEDVMPPVQAPAGSEEMGEEMVI